MRPISRWRYVNLRVWNGFYHWLIGHITSVGTSGNSYRAKRFML